MSSSNSSIARLNVFQRLVRQWDRVHPYNAAQVLRLSVLPDHPSLQAAWYESLVVLGLGTVRTDDRRHFSFQSISGQRDACALPQVPPGLGLENFLSLEMNRPFTEKEVPLRPFVLIEPESNGRLARYFIGVVYQHWIADSESIRLLLREWFVRVFDPGAASQQPLQLPRTGYWGLFGPRPGRWHLDDQLLRLLQVTIRLRSVRKLRTFGDNDYNMRFLLRRLPDGEIVHLRALARDKGVTLNDLFLGVMAQLCDEYLPLRQTHRRRDLALGTIVDLRSRSKNAQSLANTFGLFLGFANVICRSADLRCWPRLVRDIARQTRHQKNTGSAESSALWMWLALSLTRIMKPNEIYHFYRRRMPLAAGISNVNLTHSWAQKYYPQPLYEYIRVSPTGPMVPMVFTPSTLGNTFHVAMTYRCSLITAEAAQEMADRFVQRLTELAATDDALL